MNKPRSALFCLIAFILLNLTSCETLVNAFADQTGRNIANAIWGKKDAEYEETHGKWSIMIDTAFNPFIIGR